MGGRWGVSSSRRRGRWARRSIRGFAGGVGGGARRRRWVAARVRRERLSRRVGTAAVGGSRRLVARLVVGRALWDMAGLVLVDIGLGGVVGIGMGVCTLVGLSRRTTSW